MRKRELHRCVLLYIEFVNKTTLYFRELSYAFDFIESCLSRPITRLNNSLKDELLLIAFANTFDEERACF